MKRIICLSVYIIFTLSVFAQNDTTWKCATDEKYREIIAKNPEILIERQKLDEFVQDFIKNNPKTDEIYVIPVVFHVVHNYGEENISYEQILGAIDWMNKDYRKQRADTISIHPAFKNIAADSYIEFRLAKIDPNGECTIGVTRTISQTTYGGGEEAKDAAPTWPPDKYLNIWTVFSLGEGAAGWSYYPGTAPYGSDGIILIHDYIGVTGTSDMSHGSVITHEAGHYLNLPHPWGSTNDPGLQSNCDIDDGIEDTPNTIGHTDCNINAITCGSLDNVQNFMEYSYCYKMFTNGQSDVMRATLNSNVSGRNNLWSSSNRIATGTNDGYVPEICAPIADFSTNKTVGCTGFSVQYNDLSHNTDFIGIYQWNTEGGTPSVSNEPNPLIQYNEKGRFDANLYVENPTDSDSKLLADYIRVYDPIDGYPLPYTETFETTTFPLVTGNTNNDFYLVESGDRHWEQSSVGYTGKSVKVVNKYNDNGTKNKIFLPNLYIDQPYQSVKITFKTAYGRISTTYSDRLKISISVNCGDSLRLVSVLSGSTLTSEYVSANTTYIPALEDWKTQTFTISGNYIKSNNLRLVFESESNGGNAIYIDDVTAEIVTSGISEESSYGDLSVYPNPCMDELYIQNPGQNDEVVISIIDYTGKILSSANAQGELINVSSLIENLPSGIYFLRVSSENSLKTIKLVKD